MTSSIYVVDANVLVRGLRSRNGASHRVLQLMLAGRLQFALSPAVLLEYEDVLKRPGMLGSNSAIGEADIDCVLDALCAMAIETASSFRFRPFLSDPKDDPYLECALAGGARSIVTSDRHFRHPVVAAFGLRAISPGELISEMEGG